MMLNFTNITVILRKIMWDGEGLGRVGSGEKGGWQMKKSVCFGKSQSFLPEACQDALPQRTHLNQGLPVPRQPQASGLSPAYARCSLALGCHRCSRRLF